MNNDGIVIVLDFTRVDEPDVARDHLSYSQRSVKGGRRTGKREGTVAAYTRRIVVCPHCGRKRMDFDGPHSLINTNDVGVQLDCIGRRYLNGALLNGPA